jgi:hypothetical protein
LSPDDLEKKKKEKIFMTNSMTINQIKSKLVRILNKLYPSYELTDDSVRIWKANMTYYTVEKIVGYLR